MQYYTLKFINNMPYIAQKTDTGEIFYSKGANKIANLLKINPTTITKYKGKGFKPKEYNGYRFAKVELIENKDRGNNIKNNLNRI